MVSCTKPQIGDEDDEDLNLTTAQIRCQPRGKQYKNTMLNKVEDCDVSIVPDVLPYL